MYYGAMLHKVFSKGLMFRLNILTYLSYDKTEISQKLKPYNIPCCIILISAVQENLRLWKTLQWFAICPWVFRKNAF